MGRFVKAIFGGAEPRTPAPVPAADTSAADELETERQEARRRRSALFATEGGAAGQELAAGGVSQRSTLLGN